MRSVKAKIGFWLPWVLISSIFWLSTHWLTHQVLNQAYSLDVQLNVDLKDGSKAQLMLMAPVTAMSADVDPEDDAVEVVLAVVHPALKRLEFEFPMSDRDLAKSVLAPELPLEPSVLEHLIRSHTSSRASYAE